MTLKVFDFECKEQQKSKKLNASTSVRQIIKSTDFSL